MKYTLYHIKGVKWGMTCNLIDRLRRQGYTISDCFEFEYYDDEHIASNREMELNIKFGYKNQTHDYRKVTALRKKHTPDTNIKISKTRSGQKVGEDGPNNKLTSKDVLDIRNRYKPNVYTMQMLADEYNVSKVMIGKIIRKERWKHL